ncbi:hypothetical protein [Actinoplanes xinjiangensis]|uniref:Uncharacterized protein n=1 Tax=Actinoplanes xinjiangensis TaxID=512350 RepID=A0A316F350_9ACTN|nr:hypothetical protein [Actinoplanes xinjiangensis]PWK39241.1 hypothetical protein BC793_12378 [Actinoplanes xinjiangensis]GIF43820.1 hypothetical protein Axi01nite_81310 [Actinoplanes xinjiangensis]
MSYAVPTPIVAAPPAGRRPVSVATAVALLWAMAAAGLTYAIGMVVVTAGVVGRFRDAVAGSDVADNFVAVMWLVAALALVLSLLVTALFVVLGIALRRGSRLGRGITLGVCVLGVLAGCGTLAILAAQRAGDAAPGTLSEALNSAYPNGWIVLNVVVAVAQVVAYLVVGLLVLVTPRGFFGHSPSSEWAIPQTNPFVTGGSEPDQFSDPAVSPKSTSNPEDEFWSRPNE